MSRIYPGPLIAIVFLFLSLNVWSQCTISGQITDVNNIAIKNSRMVLVKAESEVKITSECDSAGYFKSGLPSGQYDIRFEAPGYKPLKGSIQFFDGDNTELGNIVLRIDDTIATDRQSTGQYIITGQVTEGDNSPIEFAAVRFLTNDSTYITGAVTDSIGHFTTYLPATGNYRVIISALGYTPEIMDVSIDSARMEISPLILHPHGNELGEVTVSAGYMTRVDGHLQAG